MPPEPQDPIRVYFTQPESTVHLFHNCHCLLRRGTQPARTTVAIAHPETPLDWSRVFLPELNLDTRICAYCRRSLVKFGRKLPGSAVVLQVTGAG